MPLASKVRAERHTVSVWAFSTSIISDTVSASDFADGQWRTLFPQSLQGVEIGAQRDATLSFQLLCPLFHRGSTVHHTIHAHHGSPYGAEFLSQPAGDRGSSFHTFFHQHDACALQLLLCRQEVARVGPQRSFFQSNHHSTCRPIEATHIFSPFPMVGHILSMMGVGTRKDEGMHPLFPQKLSQVIQTLHYCWFCHYFVICTLQRYAFSEFITNNLWLNERQYTLFC